MYHSSSTPFYCDLLANYVCTIFSVICVCPIVFESHLMGRRHAARVKKHGEVLFDDKKFWKKVFKEKDHPRDTLEEVKKTIMGLDKKTKTPCGFCFVLFYSREDTEDVISLCLPYAI